ncbi:MAG TPA: hypothetical protein VK783_06225, partial [Bacteroidia bacterium]|nr:hypothetical protein [Bacteroidia bacterium]
MRKWICVFILSGLGVVTANAQWFEIKPYIYKCTNYSNTSCYSQGRPIVVGNGVILYGDGWCGLGGGHDCAADLMESDNDLFTAGSIAGQNNTAPVPIYSIASKNDSTIFCYFGFYYLQGQFTTNNFATTSSVNISGYTNAEGFFPSCFSTNYIYAAPCLHSNDTILLNCVDIKSATVKLDTISNYRNSLYIGFTSDSTGYIICSYKNAPSKSVLIKTSDSGRVWIDSFLDSVNTITGCSFPSISIGYITENNGNIYKTTNGGTSWLKLISPATVSLNCISFSSDSMGYVAGNGGVLYQTINGGTSWATETSGDTSAINSLFTFDTIAYFIDRKGNIYKNVKPTGIEYISNQTKLFTTIYPNPNNGEFTIKSSVTGV